MNETTARALARVRLILWALVAVAALGAVVLYLVDSRGSPEGTIAHGGAEDTAMAKIGPPIEE